MAPVGENGATDGVAGDGLDDGGDPGATKSGGLGLGSGGYVPPHLRGGKVGAAGGEKMGGRERDDLATLRVTNVGPRVQTRCLCMADLNSRCRNLLKRTTFGRYSSDSDGSPVSSSRRTEILVVQRGLRLSALLTERTLLRLVIRLTVMVTDT